MNTSILRSAAALLGALILAVTLGGQPVRAQTAGCPCLTGDLVDAWFQARPPSVDQPDPSLFCVDGPVVTTIDYLDSSAPDRSIYIDLLYPTSTRPARCTVDLIHAADDLLTDSRAEITDAQASACHEEILASQTWGLLGCPTN